MQLLFCKEFSLSPLYSFLQKLKIHNACGSAIFEPASGRHQLSFEQSNPAIGRPTSCSSRSVKQHVCECTQQAFAYPEAQSLLLLYVDSPVPVVHFEVSSAAHWRQANMNRERKAHDKNSLHFHTPEEVCPVKWKLVPSETFSVVAYGRATCRRLTSCISKAAQKEMPIWTIDSAVRRVRDWPAAKIPLSNLQKFVQWQDAHIKQECGTRFLCRRKTKEIHMEETVISQTQTILSPVKNLFWMTFGADAVHAKNRTSCSFSRQNNLHMIANTKMRQVGVCHLRSRKPPKSLLDGFWHWLVSTTYKLPSTVRKLTFLSSDVPAELKLN